MKTIPINSIHRQCGECSKCCDGWLEADIHGHKMYPGKPCYFLADHKCSIYKDRPHVPCRTYNCEWLNDLTFPEWLKPNLCNVIITKKIPADIRLTYYEISETGTKIDSTVLNWILLWAIQDNINLIYSIDGEKHCLGDERFYNEIVNVTN